MFIVQFHMLKTFSIKCIISIVNIKYHPARAKGIWHFLLLDSIKMLIVQFQRPFLLKRIKLILSFPLPMFTLNKIL